MPALDRYHHAVRNALVKDCWTITADPLLLRVEEDDLYVDLAGEKLIEAEKDIRRIAVEVKMFAGASKIADLEAAVGQYVIYRTALLEVDAGRELWRAAPQSVIENRFERRALWRAVVDRTDLKLLGYDPETEEVTVWLGSDRDWEVVEHVLCGLAERYPSRPPVRTLVAFDREHGQFLVLHEGWDGYHRTHGVLAHVEVAGGKYLVHEDGYEDGVASLLAKLRLKPSSIRPKPKLDPFVKILTYEAC